jgi:hypothetical protein
MAVMRRHLRTCAGFLALLAGVILALPLVPGPGIPLILLGLVLLSDRFTWAKRCLGWAKRKWRRLRGVACPGGHLGIRAEVSSGLDMPARKRVWPAESRLYEFRCKWQRLRAK